MFSFLTKTKDHKPSRFIDEGKLFSGFDIEACGARLIAGGQVKKLTLSQFEAKSKFFAHTKCLLQLLVQGCLNFCGQVNYQHFHVLMNVVLFYGCFKSKLYLKLIKGWRPVLDLRLLKYYEYQYCCYRYCSEHPPLSLQIIMPD